MLLISLTTLLHIIKCSTFFSKPWGSIFETVDLLQEFAPTERMVSNYKVTIYFNELNRNIKSYNDRYVEIISIDKKIYNILELGFDKNLVNENFYMELLIKKIVNRRDKCVNTLQKKESEIFKGQLAQIDCGNLELESINKFQEVMQNIYKNIEERKLNIQLLTGIKDML